MTIVEATRSVIGVIDTDSQVHVAAVLDEVGGLLGVLPTDLVDAENPQMK